MDPELARAKYSGRSRMQSLLPEYYCDINPETNLYPKVFDYFEVQRAAITKMVENMEDLKSKVPKDEQVILCKIIQPLNSLLFTSYGYIFETTDLITGELKALIAEGIPPRYENFAYQGLCTLAALLRVRSLMSISKTANTRRISFDERSTTEEELENCVLCRICENYIPLDQIEEHAKVCVYAYQQQKNILTVDEKLSRLRYNAQVAVLNKPWPGTSGDSIGFLLPILHLCILIDRLINIDLDDTESGSRMAQVQSSIEIIRITSPGHEVARDILMRAIGFTRDKMKACNILEHARTVSGVARPRMRKLSIADFKFLKRISAGAYARVFLAKKNTTGDIFAIKAIPKANIKMKNELQRLIIEKNIMQEVFSNYIVKFFYSITGSNNFYIVMEYLPGGDLFSILEQLGSFSEEATRIYTAQILGALKCLRANNIIHRDLKPDNVLVDARGHVKLADFGLSFYGMVERSIPDTAIVGTPDYIAPEVILAKPHTFAADYWSLGVMVVEFLTGAPPFHAEGDSETETFRRACKGLIDDDVMSQLSPNAADLVRKLLVVEPEKRLGFADINEILQHPFFAGIDFDRLDALEPPFVPRLDNAEDTSYFISRYAEVDDQDIVADMEAGSHRRSYSFGPESMLPPPLSSEDSSLLASESPSDGSFPVDGEDGIDGFPSVSLPVLVDSTLGAAHMLRKARASSFARPLAFPVPTPRPIERTVDRPSVKPSRLAEKHPRPISRSPAPAKALSSSGPGSPGSPIFPIRGGPL